MGISLRILIKLQAGRPENGDSVLSWGGDFSLRQRVKTTPEGHLSFHPIDTENFFAKMKWSVYDGLLISNEISLEVRKDWSHIYTRKLKFTILL